MIKLTTALMATVAISTSQPDLRCIEHREHYDELLEKYDKLAISHNKWRNDRKQLALKKNVEDEKLKKEIKSLRLLNNKQKKVISRQQVKREEGDDKQLHLVRTTAVGIIFAFFLVFICYQQCVIRGQRQEMEINDAVIKEITEIKGKEIQVINEAIQNLEDDIEKEKVTINLSPDKQKDRE